MNDREVDFGFEETPYKKKAFRGCKPFAVLCKIDRGRSNRGWGIWSRYRTEKQRDQVLQDVINSHSGYDWINFRKGSP